MSWLITGLRAKVDLAAQACADFNDGQFDLDWGAVQTRPETRTSQETTPFNLRTFWEAGWKAASIALIISVISVLHPVCRAFAKNQKLGPVFPKQGDDKSGRWF